MKIMVYLDNMYRYIFKNKAVELHILQDNKPIFEDTGLRPGDGEKLLHTCDGFLGMWRSSYSCDLSEPIWAALGALLGLLRSRT